MTIAHHYHYDSGLASLLTSWVASTKVNQRRALLVLGWATCRMSHACHLLKRFDGFMCHLAGALVGPVKHFI